MDTNEKVYKAIRDAYGRFYRLACPTWNQMVKEADAAFEQSQNRRADGRRRQFSVGIADRAQLERLAETLELPRSKVINLALKEFAEKVGVFDDVYAELFAESCQRAARYLSEEYDLDEEESVAVAERFGQKYLPKRKVWLRIIKGETRPLPPDYISTVRFVGEGGCDNDPDGRKKLLWERFEDDLIALFSGRWCNRIKQWINQR